MQSDFIENDLECGKEYQKLKQQNVKLRNELKQINEFLSKQVERKRATSSHKVNTSKDLKDETLRAELVNAQKQIKIQQKQISLLQSRQDQFTFDNLSSLQAQLKQQGEQLREQQLTIKILQGINQKQEKKLLEVMDDEFFKQRLCQLEDDNKTLRNRLQQAQQKERCHSLNQQIQQPQPLKPIQLTQKQNEIVKEKETLIQQLMTKNYEQEKHLKVLNNLKEQYDKQINTMKFKIKKLETIIHQLQQQLQDKSQELNKKTYLLPNLSQRSKIKKLNQSVDVNKLSKIVRVEELGQIINEDGFKDQLSNVKLHNLQVFFQDNFIKGIQAIYQDNELNHIKGSIHSKLNTDDLTQQYVELSLNDLIKSIKVGFENKCLRYIELNSQQGCTLKFGEWEGEGLLDFGEQIYGIMRGSFKEDFISSIGFQILSD